MYNTQNCSIQRKQTTKTIQKGSKDRVSTNFGGHAAGLPSSWSSGTQQQQPTSLEMAQKYISSSEVMTFMVPTVS
jgi:hypothetical protein